MQPPGYGGPPGFGPPPAPPGSPGGYGPPPGPPGYGPPPGGGYGAPPPMFGPPGFGPGGFGPPPPMPGGQTETLAIISLVLGVLSLPGSCCCSIFAAPFAIGGGVTGIMSLSKINASAGTLGGKPMAIAGIVCSGVALLLAVARLVLGFGMLATQLFK